jgi:hypothetical protein
VPARICARRRCTRFVVAVADQAARDVVAREFGDRAADREQAGRIVEQFLVAAIPRDHVERGVDDANALAHVLERGFEHALVEAQILARLADDVGHGVELAAAFAARDFDEQSRRRRADDGGEFVFDYADRLRIRDAARGADERVDAFARQKTQRERAELAAREFARLCRVAAARPARA